jgi:hypothetical protein
VAVDDDPELDDIPREQLGEGWLGEMPVHVLAALTSWASLKTQHLLLTDRRWHGVGTFLDELAARGYRVTPIEAGILTPPFDNGGALPAGGPVRNDSGAPIPILPPPTE